MLFIVSFSQRPWRRLVRKEEKLIALGTFSLHPSGRLYASVFSITPEGRSLRSLRHGSVRVCAAAPLQHVAGEHRNLDG